MWLLVGRTLLFFLLGVDWAEDPHLGRYLFSQPMSSTDVSPLELVRSTLFVSSCPCSADDVSGNRLKLT